MDAGIGPAEEESKSLTVADTPPQRRAVGAIRQASALVGAAICLTLAAFGFFLPLLPCTPFVLLASFLLINGSPAMHRRLRASRFFGRILADWEDRKGIRPADKVRAIIVVICGLLMSLTLGQPSAMLRSLILFFVLIGLWVIIRLPVAKDPEL